MPPRVEASDGAALIARLQAHRAEPAAQAACCAALCDSGQLSQEGALTFLPAVVAALRAHPTHARLQRNGCRALGLMCRQRSEGALEGAAGGADGGRAAIAALRAHATDPDVQAWACKAVSVLSHAPRLRALALGAGAVDACVGALRAHGAADAGAAMLACEALSRLTREHAGASAAACAAGVVPGVLAALRAHAAVAQLQALACSALGFLTLDDATRAAAVDAGAPETVLRALAAHGAASADVSMYACAALDSLLQGQTVANAYARSSSSVLLHDAMRAMTAALRAHPTEPGVAQHACDALVYLPVTAALRNEARRLGVVTAVVAAMRAHADDERCQRAACCFLAVAVAGHAANARDACDAGALQALLAAMRAHDAHVALQLVACRALEGLVSALPDAAPDANVNVNLAAAAGAAGAMPLLVRALALRAPAPHLPRAACTALLALVLGHPGNGARACAAGVMPALAAAMSTRHAHEGTDTVFSAYICAVGALAALLESGDADARGDAARRAVQAGVLDIMARQAAAAGSSFAEHPRHAHVLSLLQAAAARHDAAVCTHD
jgi:hypothetical protein